MIREIITTDQENYIIHLPKEYLNRKLEILILPFDENVNIKTNDFDNIIDESNGIFAGKKINPVNWQKQMRKEWD